MCSPDSMKTSPGYLHCALIVGLYLARSWAGTSRGTEPQWPRERPATGGAGLRSATSEPPITREVEGSTKAGVISAIGTNGFSLLSSPDGLTTVFVMGPGTAFVDSEGRTVPRERFTNQVPAIVYYMRSEDVLVATRVVARSGPGIFSIGTTIPWWRALTKRPVSSPSRQEAQP